MEQNRLESFLEALANTVIGLLVTMLVYPVINWICGIEMSIGQAGLSTLLFAIVSIIRSYLLRRYFGKIRLFRGYRKQEISN